MQSRQLNEGRPGPNYFLAETAKKAFIGALKDPTGWSLVLSNLAAIFFAFTQNWSIAIILWTYWLQSIIIGFFNFFKILSLKEFSVDGFQINNKNVDAGEKTKITTALLFVLHYGIFHFFYAVFLLSELTASVNAQEIEFILVAGAVFFTNHLFSFGYYFSKPKPKQNIGTVMFFPFARIIPMHLTIILGAVFIWFGMEKITIAIFMLLKMLADLLMHEIEHLKQQGGG